MAEKRNKYEQLHEIFNGRDKEAVKLDTRTKELSKQQSELSAQNEINQSKLDQLLDFKEKA